MSRRAVLPTLMAFAAAARSPLTPARAADPAAIETDLADRRQRRREARQARRGAHLLNVPSASIA